MAAEDKETKVTVLVTGAAGLLGGHVADLLAERGEPVRALIRRDEDPARLAALGVDVRQGDLIDRGSLEAAVHGVDVVLHCAARTGPWGPAGEYENANVYGLKSLVEASLKAGVRRFVHVSSVTVHGNAVGGAADETAPIRVEPNPYSRTKVAGERLVERLVREQGAPVVVVRPGLIYGPRDRGSFARFAALVRDGKMPIIGAGRNHIPLVYVRDVAAGVILAGQAGPEAVGRAYLLVNDEPVTQYAYLATIAGELGVPAPARHIPYRAALGLGLASELVGRARHSDQPPPLMRYGLQLLGGENQFVISRARRELGFEPRVDLATGVRESVAWFRSTQCTPLAA
jgi:nucleoside-diphosphate-sugar epimerase